MSISDNFTRIKQALPSSVELIAVSKTKPNSDILEVYNAGHRAFGENKVQDLVAKYESLPKDIEWHMIGHVQSNKLKYITPFVHLIHGIDKVKTLKELNKQAAKNDRVVRCLLQIHIAQEESKFGFSPEEVTSMVENNELEQFPNVQVVGLMGMATNTSDKSQVSNEFNGLSALYQQLKAGLGEDFNTLSMGMSGDYIEAIEEGSTMVRVGSSIFGARNYGKL